MAAGQRPGGLTALAVLNFVFGGFGVIGLFIIYAAISAAESASGGRALEESTKSSAGILGWVYLLAATAVAVLLIVSGVGYLGMKRKMGRGMGNAYAVCSLAMTALGVVTVGFGFMSVIGLVYPLLTLMLVNGTFKEDLVN